MSQINWRVYDTMVKKKVEELKKNFEVAERKMKEQKAAYDAGLRELEAWHQAWEDRK